MASTAIATSVAEAFFDSGGRNAGTPFETASTPVIAVQPLANAVSSRNIVSRVEPALAGSGRVERHDRAAGVAVEADREQHEDADDEEVGRDGEDAAGLADAAEVAEHQNGQKAEAQSRRGTPSSAGHGRRDGEHAGRDADRHGQRVVDEERRRGDEAGGLRRCSPWRRCTRRRPSGRRGSSGGRKTRRWRAALAMTRLIGIA